MGYVKLTFAYVDDVLLSRKREDLIIYKELSIVEFLNKDLFYVSKYKYMIFDRNKNFI